MDQEAQILLSAIVGTILFFLAFALGMWFFIINADDISCLLDSTFMTLNERYCHSERWSS
jgi:hypothetical protein